MRDIKILDHIPSPILLVDCNGIIGEDYSKASISYFGNGLNSKKASDIIFTNAKIQKAFDEWIEFVPSNPLSDSDIIGLAPSRTSVFCENKKTHISFAIDYSILRDKQENIQGVMMTFNDKSAENRLCKVVKQRMAKSDLVFRILKNKESYLDFLSELTFNLKILNDIMKTINAENLEEQINAAFRSAHTIKGNSSSYGVIELAASAHILEEKLISARDGTIENIKIFSRQCLVLINQIRVDLGKHVDEMESLFGERFNTTDGESALKIQGSQIDELTSLSGELKEQSQVRRDLSRKIYELKMVPIAVYLNPFKELVSSLSKELDKRIMPLIITGGNTMINRSQLSKFFSSFVHLIRNCVDHGIETIDEREKTSKSPSGKISITASTKNEVLEIIVKDDGRGIDTEILKNKVKEKELLSAHEVNNMNEEEALKLIFLPGFSTKDQVTNTSGRGVGMDALNFEVTDLKGNIVVKSVKGQGSEFIITIPLSEEYIKVIQDNKEIKGVSRVSRNPVTSSLPFYDKNDTVIGTIKDINTDGCGIKFNIDPKLKDGATQIITLEDECIGELCIQIEVCWAKDEVYGCKFIDVSSDNAAKVLKYVQEYTF